jgi:signal transduction histidine kinase
MDLLHTRGHSGYRERPEEVRDRPLLGGLSSGEATDRMCVQHIERHVFLQMPGRGKPGVANGSRLAWNGWVAGAGFVVALGVIGSILAASTVARGDGQKAQRAFAASSAGVVSTLRLAIQHEQDLVLNTNAFWVSHPNMSSAVFDKWVQADHVIGRYPELLGLGTLVIVPASGVAAFAARTTTGRAGSPRPRGSFKVMPPGKRPFYCFSDVGARALAGIRSPAGDDYCAGPVGALLLSVRDSAKETYFPVRLAKTDMLGVEAPAYRGGVIPSTVPARRAAFIGWVGVVLLPKVVLSRALAEHRATAATFRFSRGAGPIAFSSGKAPRGAQTLTTDLHNGWTVQTSAAVAAGSIFTNGNAFLLLAGGTLLSLLLGLLTAVLATGRARAFRLVNEQTLELRDQAAELRTTVQELEAAQAVKNEFLALVSHELRTPLTSIRGYTELLAEEKLSDAQREFLAVISRSSTRLLSLIEDLLVMTQIQSGGLSLKLGEVILDDLVANSTESAEPFAASKQIALSIESEADLATEGDTVRLGQALDNLVSNAIKYTPSGGRVSITTASKGEIATITVSDTGIGIPRDEQAQIFDRFFRTSNAQTSGIQGTGLGLAITRGIVEAHGGTIAFDSDEGKGTTFRITLPHAHGAGLELAA